MSVLTQLNPGDYKSHIPADWCPGCGDFGVLNALQRACADLGLEPHEIVVVSGIGCSSNLPGFFRSYGVHTLHGRAVPVATGIKLANHALTVIVTGGDGDGYGIGLSHFIHAIRRNIDLTYIVMNNQVYGLTTGQVSPTSEAGMATKTTPGGNVEEPINPLALALASGAGYVARGFSGDVKQLTEMCRGAIQHRGFALVDVFSPCVTFNKVNTYSWFRERIVKLQQQDHHPTDLSAAIQQAWKSGSEIPIGLFYHSTRRPSLQDMDPVLVQGPLVKRSLGLTNTQGAELLGEFM